MKKKTLFIITTVFVLVAFIVLCRMLDTASADGGAFSEAKQSNYFSDDFADDRYLDGVAYQWTERDKNPLSVSRTINVGGTLVIENQNAAQTDNNYACTFLQAHNAASGTDYAQSWNNYNAELRGKLNSGNLTDQSKFGLIGRAKLQQDGSIDYYLACLRNSKNNVFLYHVTIGTNGNQTSTLLGSAACEFTTDTFYTLKMAFNGSTIKVFVDGVEKIQLDDQSISSGSVGFQLTRVGAAELDYLIVNHDDDETVVVDEFYDTRYFQGVTYTWNADDDEAWERSQNQLCADVETDYPSRVTANWTIRDDPTYSLMTGNSTLRSVSANGFLQIENRGANSDGNYSHTILSFSNTSGSYSPQWDNYDVEMSAKVSDLRDKNKLSLMGRVQTNQDGSLSYYKLLCRENSWVYLYKCDLSSSGTETATELGRYNAGIDLSTTVVFKLRFSNSTIKVFINNSTNECISYNDNSNPISSGTVGIQLKRKGIASIDSLTVTDTLGTVLFTDPFSNGDYLTGVSGYFSGLRYCAGDLPVYARDISYVVSEWEEKDDPTYSQIPLNSTIKTITQDGFLQIENRGANSDGNYSNMFLKLDDSTTNHTAFWTDYSVEIRAKITELSSTDGNSKNKLSLLGRVLKLSDDSYQYYKLLTREDNGYVYLYKCTLSSAGTETSTEVGKYNAGIAIDTNYVNLKLAFENNYVNVYINGSTTACISTAVDSLYTSGGVGVQFTRRGKAVVDYFHVNDSLGQELFVDSFTDNTSLTGRSGYLYNHHFSVGVPTLTTEGSVQRVVLTDGTADYTAFWTNYDVETEFLLDDTDSAAGIVARSNSSGYYELRFTSSEVALLSIQNGLETKLLSVPASIVSDTWHFSRLYLRENVIEGYLDGTLVLTYSNAVTGGSGTAGLKALGNVRFDNFVLYPVLAEDGRRYKTYSFGVNTLDQLSNVWNIDNTVWSLSDSALVSSGTGLAGLKSKYALSSYFVETKVSVPTNGGAGVIGRATPDYLSYYEFSIDANNGAYLKRTTNGTTTILGQISRQSLYLKGIRILPGEDVILRLQMYDDMIEGFVNGIRVIRIQEDENDVLSGGVGGFIGGSGTEFRYLTLGRVDAAVHISIIDSQDNPVATINNPWIVTLGKKPDIKKLKLNIQYYDGSSQTIPLDTASIGSFTDGSTAGNYEAAVEFDGLETTFYYSVATRTGAIQQIEADIQALDLSSLTLSDDEDLRELINRYNDLSHLEKNGITNSSKDKINSAEEYMEVLKYPALTGTQIVWRDRFDTTASEANYINDGSVTGKKYNGFYSVENGEMVGYSPTIVEYPQQFSSAASIEGHTWEIKSVSLDVQFIKENAWAGFFFCFRNNEKYAFYITNKGNRIRLSKNDTLLELIYSAQDQNPLEFETDIWYNLRVVLDGNGLIKCYVDDRLWIEYQDVPTVTDDEILTTGTVALAYSEQYVKFDNLIVRGTELTYAPDEEITYNPNLLSTYWADDFEDETTGQNPSHWIEKNTEDKWKTALDASNLVYASSNGTNGFSHTWLHVFETNVDMLAKIKVTATGAYPAVGLMARINTDSSWIKGGYDFTLQKWFIKVRLGVDFEEIVTYSAASDTTVDFSNWVPIRLKAEGDVIQLFKGGSATPIVTADAGTKVMPGRVGVFTEYCNITLDDVDLTLISGQGKVNDGVLEYYTDNCGVSSLYHSILEMWDTNNNQILLLYEDGTQSISTDGGQTFTPSTLYSSAGFKGNSSLELHDGSYLNIKKNGSDGRRLVYRSTDNGASWPQVGEIPLDLTIEHAQPAEHINEYQLANGTWRIFYCLSRKAEALGRLSFTEVYYSDNSGYTWQKALTSPYDFCNLKTFSEGYVVKLLQNTLSPTGQTIPAGTMILYSSYTSGNNMRYSLSYDGGITWEGDYAIPQLPGSMHSCCIKEDPYNPGTYYMAYTYTPSAMCQFGFPRHRVSLMRSTDGLNWSYLCDVDRWGDVSDGNHGSILQSVNMYLCITQQYVFVAFSRSEKFSNQSSHNEQRGRLYRFEKNKLSAYNPWPQEYIVPDKTITTIKAEPLVTTFEVGSTFNVTGGKIRVYYYDGTNELFNLSEAFLSEPDLDSIGQKTVIVDFKHFRTTFTIEVVAQNNP